MAKSKYKQITSPKGEASWAHLRTPEEYKGKSTGKYSITLKLSQEDTNALLAQIEAEYQSLKKNAKEFAGFKPKKGSSPSFGTKEDQNGDTVFKFGTKAEGTNRNGETWKRTIPIFDAAGKPLPKDTMIGNGSTVRVCFEIGPKAVDSANYGVVLYLAAVKVLNLVEFGGGRDQSAFGFEAEEGYSADEPEFDVSESDEDADQGDEEEF